MNDSNNSRDEELAAKKTVLIIEDQIDLCRTLALRLEHSGMRVLSEQDGRSGMDCFRNERPDAVLLDLRLPDGDGFSLLAEMREVPGMIDTPVVIMTGNSSSHIESEAMSHGATQIFRKPLMTAEIVKSLEEALAA